jgi:hypothetical protein
MTWVAWRQQRTESLLGIVILVLVAALFVPTGLEMASAYRHDGLSACLGQNGSSTCRQALDAFHQRFGQLDGLTGWLTLLPGLIGVMLAAPFVLQLENGTYRLDWTQSVTRGRWIVTKLGLAVAGTVVFSAVYVALVTGWRAPLVHIDGRMGPSGFDSEGVVVFGYTLFALGLALAIGVLWRRAVAALVVAFVGYFAARVFMDTWLRQRLTPPAGVTWLPRGPQPGVLNHAWVLSEQPSTKLGHVVQTGPCLKGAGGPSACVIHGAGYLHTVFEPATRFWSMQLVEFGLFAGVALVLVGFAGWWTHVRTV